MTAQPAEMMPAHSGRAATRRLISAVGQDRALSRQGLGQRVFARLFKGLVYAQIWEDPDVDMEALQIRQGERVVAIASGGCNSMSYLAADPASVETVDLNPAHVAFNRLKIAALAALPDYDAFYRFFGQGQDRLNIEAYRRFIQPKLDEKSRAYWDGRGLSGRRRIGMFARNPYRHGLLGKFIGAAHGVARLHGVDPKEFLKARDLGEQRAFFDGSIAPLFERPLVRWATARKSTLFGLGIPPQQYDVLAGARIGGMASVLRSRLERLSCDFPLERNYFAWQAFGRRYDSAGPLPPYLHRETYEAIRSRAGRLSIANLSLTEFLAEKQAGSVDCFVLLDAQDWMTDEQLNELWSEIDRTARSGARVIFRTAAAPTVLTGRVDEAILGRWRYAYEESLRFHAADRSSIYGGFHLYVRAGEAS
jgi:S-adenosylmethionine-diacylglycerol 3-amino-3-carboxypropyl transferase